MSLAKYLLISFSQRCLLLLITLLFMQTAYAKASENKELTADIHIHITGTAKHNRYFLCLPDMGCLSILIGDQGKSYQFIQPIQLADIYITDMENMHIYREATPPSCQANIPLGSKVTISGELQQNGELKNLVCDIQQPKR